MRRVQKSWIREIDLFDGLKLLAHPNMYNIIIIIIIVICEEACDII